MKTCNDPKCNLNHENNRWVSRPGPDLNCKCHGPWAISLRPGEHFHPCSVHPDTVIVGTFTYM